MAQVTPEQIVAAARTFQFVPYRHRGHDPATGLDCLGLVVATARKVGALYRREEADAVYSFSPDGYYLVRRFRECCEEVAGALAGARPGDVALCRWHESLPPQHCGVVTEIGEDYLKCVHSSRAERRVVENRWPDLALVTNVFRFRESI